MQKALEHGLILKMNGKWERKKSVEAVWNRMSIIVRCGAMLMEIIKKGFFVELRAFENKRCIRERLLQEMKMKEIGICIETDGYK